jgi:hypothetical protein
MRKEIEAAAKQFAAMMEQLLVLLEEYRAGRLTAPNAPPGVAARRALQITPAALMTDRSACGVDRRAKPGDDDKGLMRWPVAESALPVIISTTAITDLTACGVDRRAKPGDDDKGLLRWPVAESALPVIISTTAITDLTACAHPPASRAPPPGSSPGAGASLPQSGEGKEALR